MRVVATLLTAALLSLAPSASQAADERAAPAPASIRFAFKLDPRLAGPTYGGERWVSPPTYQGATAQSTVEAKASAVDAKGQPTKASVDWKPSEPEMVSVAPARGEQVKITVKRAGESSLTVTSGKVSRKLVVKAVDRNGIRQVTIAQ